MKLKRNKKKTALLTLGGCSRTTRNYVNKLCPDSTIRSQFVTTLGVDLPIYKLGRLVIFVILGHVM